MRNGPDDPKPLSAREIDVLCLIAEGHRTKEIAARLGISPKSVEFYKTRLYVKIGATGVVTATRFAIREGYVARGLAAGT